MKPYRSPSCEARHHKRCKQSVVCVCRCHRQTEVVALKVDDKLAENLAAVRRREEEEEPSNGCY